MISSITPNGGLNPCHLHGELCCKDKNKTILGDSPDRQGGRRAVHDDHALCVL
jgi:hypothetical protein